MESRLKRKTIRVMLLHLERNREMVLKAAFSSFKQYHIMNENPNNSEPRISICSSEVARSSVVADNTVVKFYSPIKSSEDNSILTPMKKGTKKKKGSKVQKASGQSGSSAFTNYMDSNINASTGKTKKGSRIGPNFFL